MNDEILIRGTDGKVKILIIPDFGEYKLVIQNGKVYRIERTESEIIKK